VDRLLEVEDIVVAHGDVDVLHQVSIGVYPSDSISILGSNGAGKTTLLRAISGLLPIRAGKVTFAGTELSGIPAFKLPGLGMAHVPQGRGIFGTLSVRENLLLGGLNPLARPKRQENLEKVYQLFPRLRERSTQLAGTLSGGEQQMLAVGRALAQQPILLMLDEPSLGLAPVIVEMVFETLEKIKQEGIAILLVEQNVFFAIGMATRCYLLENGRVTLEGDREEFEQNPVIGESYLGR